MVISLLGNSSGSSVGTTVGVDVGADVGVDVGGRVGVGGGVGVKVGGSVGVEVGGGVGVGVAVGIGVEVGVGVSVGAKSVWGTGAGTMVSSSWERSPPRAETPAYRRKPKLGAGVGVDREPGRIAFGRSTLPSRVTEIANRMMVEWEVKREEKDPSLILAIEVRMLFLETQSLAFDQRMVRRPTNDLPSISPVGGKSAGISIRSPLLR